MVEIYQFLRAAEVWIYILLALAALIPMRWMIQGISDYRSSLFGLERDIARRRINQSIGFLILIVLLSVGVFGFVTFIGTSPITALMLPTPTLNLSPTSTPVLSIALGGTSNSILTSDAASSCVPGQVEWTSPQAGQEVSGKVELKGNASVPNFGFYKYEYSQNGTDWLTIQAGTSVVTNGVLGNWDTTLLVPGDYQIRLIVSDNQGSPSLPCTITIRVVPE
jgi:hypothetical protein